MINGRLLVEGIKSPEHTHTHMHTHTHTHTHTHDMCAIYAHTYVYGLSNVVLLSTTRHLQRYDCIHIHSCAHIYKHKGWSHLCAPVRTHTQTDTHIKVSNVVIFNPYMYKVQRTHVCANAQTYSHTTYKHMSRHTHWCRHLVLVTCFRPKSNHLFSILQSGLSCCLT